MSSRFAHLLKRTGVFKRPAENLFRSISRLSLGTGMFSNGEAAKPKRSWCKRSSMFLGAALFCGAAVLSAQESNSLWKQPASGNNESGIPSLVMPQNQIRLVNSEDANNSPVKAPVYKAPAADIPSLPPLSSAPDAVKSEFPAPSSLPAPAALPAPAKKSPLKSNEQNKKDLPAADVLEQKSGIPGTLVDPQERKAVDRTSQSPYNADFAKGTYVDECPDPKSLPLIKDLSYKVEPKPGQFPESCPLPDEVYVRKMPTPITFTWKASNLCYKPLYFEDVQLERYGNSFCPLLQPAISRARFWLTIPILPYLMGVNPPNECVYDLGYYRPGNCAPYMLNPIPISLRGALMEAGVIVGGCYLYP